SDHHAIDENARNTYSLRAQDAFSGDPFHLHHHDAAGVFHRLGDREYFERECFLLHRTVAFLISSGSTQTADMDGKGRQEQIVHSMDVDQLDEFLFGHVIQPASLQTWVNKGVK